MGSILEIEKNDVLKPQHLEKKEIEEAKNKFLSLWEKENISDLIIS